MIHVSCAIGVACIFAGSGFGQTVESFAPRPDDDVYALLPVSDGDVVFGGVFSLVAGVATKNLRTGFG